MRPLSTRTEKQAKGKQKKEQLVTKRETKCKERKKNKRKGDEGGRTKLGKGRGDKMIREGKEETVDRGEKDKEKKEPKN